MKNRLLLIGVATLALAAVTSQAQTAAGTNQVTTLPALPLAGGVTNEPSVSPLGQIEQAGKDGFNILKSDSFANGFTESTLLLYQSGDIGFVQSVTTDSTNSLNYGFFLGGIEQKNNVTGARAFKLYDGGLSISANGNYTLPVVGVVNLAADTGAVIDLSNPSAGAFSESTATAYKLLFTTPDGNLSIGGTGGIGYSTLFSNGRPFYVAGVTITDLLKGKHLFGLF